MHMSIPQCTVASAKTHITLSQTRVNVCLCEIEESETERLRERESMYVCVCVCVCLCVCVGACALSTVRACMFNSWLTISADTSKTCMWISLAELSDYLLFLLFF